MRKKLLVFSVVLLGVILGTFVYFFIRIEYTAVLDESRNADAIVVLGAASYAGRPSPVLAARLDHAAELFENGHAPLIITTGGIHPGEKYSEGEAGKIYLKQKGISDGKIIEEKNSLTTKQNLTRIAEIARARNISTIIIVSDPFHMYRALRIAEDLGLAAFSSPTRTSPIKDNFWLNQWYVARETALVIIHVLFDA